MKITYAPSFYPCECMRCGTKFEIESGDSVSVIDDNRGIFDVDCPTCGCACSANRRVDNWINPLDYPPCYNSVIIIEQKNGSVISARFMCITDGEAFAKKEDSEIYISFSRYGKFGI